MAELNVYRDWLEVPAGDVPPEGPPDHYALLRVPKFEDNTEKIRSGYRKLNNKVRAYASGKYSVQSQELLNELAKAMLCLTDEDRKRDYDRSLGRDVEEETTDLGRVPMGRLLVKAGKVSREQLREAEEFAEARGLELRDAVVQMKLVPAKLAYRAYAREQGYSYADLGEMNPTEEVLAQFPKATAKRHSIVPLVRDEDAILVAAAAPLTTDMEEELRLRYGVPPRLVIAVPSDINQAISRYYAQIADDAAGDAPAADGPVAKKKASAPRRSFASLDDAEKRERRQLGIIAICWAIIIPSALLYFFTNGPLLLDVVPLFSVLGGLLGGGLAAAWAFLVYWK